MQPIGHFQAQYALQRVCLVITHVLLILCILYLMFNTMPGGKTAESDQKHTQFHENGKQLTLEFLNFSRTYWVNQPAKGFCNDAKVIVLVPSRPTFGGLDSRYSIRDTWLNKNALPKNFIYKFVLGLPKITSDNRLFKIYRMLKEEMEDYDDIIFYNQPDSYEDLFIKTGVLMQWQQEFCPNATYLLKADDDTAINLNRMDEHLRLWFDLDIKQNPKMCWGKIISNSTVIRNEEDKWYIPWSEYSEEKFPDYVNGAAYIVTSAAVKDILNVTSSTRPIHLEDALFTGILAKKAGVERFDVDAFYPEYWFHKYCYDGTPTLLGVYGLSSTHISSLHNALNNITCSNNATSGEEFTGYVNRGA